SQASVSVMEVPASNCVRSITLMPARAGCTMVCVCGMASISHTSSTSHQRERPTPYTFLQGLVGWTKAAFRERIGRNPRIDGEDLRPLRHDRDRCADRN